MTFQPFYRPHIPLNGTFKGRGRDYLSLLTCPLDRAALTLDGGMVRCQSDPAHIYPFEDGILRLVSPGRRANFDTASAAWDEQGAAAGWQSPDEAQFRALPRTGLKGYPDDYWSQQAAATALLWRFLEAIRLE
ncbi:MAG: hypothetical protein JXQ72_17385, partial [Anaerolineae bacterium]|nr:hypothetical protein [Anaerolineae bacterium]